MDSLPLPLEGLVHHFRENGLKALLPEPGNLRDLLTLTGACDVERLDLTRLRVDPTTYVAADYRHLVSDLVLQVPYRTRLNGRWRTLTLYLLIEHQSTPDPLMVFRVVEYVVQIYKGQLRDWRQTHDTDDGFRFQPVLPLVLYTGETRWEALASMLQLVLAGEEFAEFIPDCKPVFLNLSARTSTELEGRGGAFGRVLDLIRLRSRAMSTFRERLVQVTSELEHLAETARDRWLLLLSYVTALVYHDRERWEHEELRDVIVSSVHTDPLRREIQTMTQSMADVLREEGHEVGFRKGAVTTLQQTLLIQLRARYGRLPRGVEKTIRATEDLKKLKTWCLRVVTAPSLEDVGILPEATP